MSYTQPILPPSPLSGMPAYPTNLKGYRNSKVYSIQPDDEMHIFYTAPGYTGFSRYQWVEIDPTTNTFKKTTDTSTAPIALALQDAGYKGTKMPYINPERNVRFLIPLKPGQTLSSTKGHNMIAGRECGIYTDTATGKQYLDIDPNSTAVKKFMVDIVENPISISREYNTDVLYIQVIVLPKYRLIS